MAKPKSSLRAVFLNIFLSIVALGLLALTVWQHRAKIQEVLSRPLDGRRLALAFAVFMTAMLLTFWRWYMLVWAQGLPFRFRDAMRLGFIGNVFNLVIPGAVGGDAIKAVFLYREQARRTQAIGSMVIDRIIGLMGLFLLATLLGLSIWPDAGPQVRRLTVVAGLGALGGGLGLAILFTPTLYRPLERLMAGRPRLKGILAELVAMAACYRDRIGVVLSMLLVSMGIHSLFVVSFYLVSLALFPTGIPSLAQHFLIVPLVLFTTAVPLPFGALGLTEQVSGQLFRLVGHPDGAVAMIGYRLLMYAGGLVSVLVYLANLRQVRSLSASAEAIEEDEPEAGPRGLEPEQVDFA